MKAARWTVVGLGVLIVCVGATVVAWPIRLFDFADLWLSTRGMWIAVALRLTFGALLWITAPASRTPKTFRVLGVLFVASGVILPFFGLDFLRGMVDWASSLSDAALRGIGLLAAVIAGFLVWSVSPRRSEA